MDADLVAELTAERFGSDIPWRERTAKPVSEQPQPDDNDLIRAQRRRDLNEAMEDVDQRFRRGHNAA
jgi:hypothetical protein